jgi:hypothetical protein
MKWNCQNLCMVTTFKTEIRFLTLFKILSIFYRASYILIFITRLTMTFVVKNICTLMILYII